MPRRPPPYTRGIFIDIHDGLVPRPGDYVVSRGVKGWGTAYLIHSSRRVERRDPEAVPRYTLRVSVTTLEEAFAPSDAQRFVIKWYPRAAKR